VALWDQGGMGPIISRMTAYALQSYFAVPRSLPPTRASRPPSRPPAFVTAGGRGQP
jgi:hypothetical protein